MTPDPTFWAQWLKPSAGLDTLQWSLLLALAALVGYVFQRHLQMPKVLGYAVVGTLAGLLGFSATSWPLCQRILRGESRSAMASECASSSGAAARAAAEIGSAGDIGILPQQRVNKETARPDQIMQIFMQHHRQFASIAGR